MKNLILSAALILGLLGCAFNGLPQGVSETTPPNVIENTYKLTFGFLVDGSSSRLNETWVVTVKHNKFILSTRNPEDVFYHPTCDFALYREPIEEYTGNGVGLVYQNQDIYHIGYPSMMPIVSHKGEFLMDIGSFNGSKCPYSVSTGTVVGGMSGGGLYNNKGELSGVTVGVITSATDRSIEGKSVFLSLYAVRKWIEEITGERFYEEL